ncbi:Protein of unknown function [Cetobacterium ceti]|uniref:DUF3798 domain-containing protein n=1 Tax=Cetobacterium ceti TaxID=180163 RepID=A0A1T4MG67_9FUSO|nr:DUF3798 domain-containing protein [Cetobacterium ceti]SJZ66029.1 Protein of unknown function [Cetobacterium ceti]
MKKILVSLFMMILSIISLGEEKYHIGIVTGTVSQSEDGLRGAEEAIKIYGSGDKGGEIVHITFPDNFMQEMETTISQIVSLADDPKMKVVIMGESIPGTVEAFRRIREKRPDIVLIANSPHEDPEMIVEVADLVTNPDSIARGYLIVDAAKKMGATKFMHISFPRHLSYELLSKRRNVMKSACEDLGLEFIEMTAPDPVSDVGVAGAQQYILEQMPTWLKKYGKDTAFFATNDAHTEPLLKMVAEKGGYFVEADLPSPTMGYPGALGINFSEDEKGNWPKILKKVETSVKEKKADGRMGTWAYSYNFSTVVALVDHSKKVIDDGVEPSDFDSLKESLAKYTPGSKWNGSNYTDVRGIEKDNFYLLYQDTYVLGKGYLGMTDVEVPEKYFSVK